MEIPIYIDGRESGRLTVCRRGGGVQLDGRLEDPGRVVRLKVFGEREFYIGVPVREGSGPLRLTRRLTPSEVRRFPQKPGYAAERPLETAEEKNSAPPAEPGRRVLWLGGRPHFF